MKFPFKNSFLSWLMRQRIHQIDFFRNHPIKVQKEVFDNLITKAKGTSFGIDHNFKNIKSYYEFKNQVPLRSYEELYPYIDRQKKGEKNVLWPGKVQCFAKSSGTTNDRSKYIPMSEESLKECHYKGGKDMLSLYCTNFPDTNIFNGKGLMLGGSLNNVSGFIEGDLSAILIKNFPFWVNMHRSPDLETSLLKEWNRKLDLITNQAIKQNITNITGVCSWVLVLLHKIIEKSGANNITEVWPNLELYMHGGVNFGPYKNQFSHMIPSSDMNYLEGYNASEGFFGIQDQKNEKDLLLMLDYGIFYEFISLSNFNKGERNTVSLRDIELGEIYVIVISTNAGLWRYIIGDTIRFTCLNPFRIKIVGRTQSYINAVGEELMVENTDQALRLASEKHQCMISDYIVSAVFVERAVAYHKWIIEFSKKPDSLEDFKLDLDTNLKLLNSDYESKRNNNFVLLPPEIVEAKSGLFYDWLEKNNRLGGQYKVPRLDNSTEIFKEISELNTTY